MLVCVKPAKKVGSCLGRFSRAGLEMADIIFTHMLLAQLQERLRKVVCVLKKKRKWGWG